MVKTLIFNNEEFHAEKIIKTDTGIIGQDINSNEIFKFECISDFDLFQLRDENGNKVNFDLSKDEINEKEKQEIIKQLAQSKLENMQKDIIVKNALKEVANIKLEIASIKKGSV